MRTTIDVDDYLLKRLRDEAHRRGVPFKEWLTTVLRRGLDERPAGSRRRFRGATHAMGAPMGGANLDKALGMAAAFEEVETVRKLRARK